MFVTVRVCVVFVSVCVVFVTAYVCERGIVLCLWVCRCLLCL